MRPINELPRDFVDRLMRTVLGRPENLADFVRAARPKLAPGFVFEKAHFASREFITEDWRRREADLLFEIPYRWGENQTEVLVWLLLEHQSDTDPIAPLRLLFETVMAWSREWQIWQGQALPRGPLRLQPVVPIVLYTADISWGSNETIRDMINGPPELRDLAPDWRPYFWNLSDHSVEELLSGGPMMQLLAVMRVTNAERAAFEEVYRRASTNLASLGGTEMVRWQELIQGLLSLGFRRQPRSDHPPLVEIVRQANPRKEVEVSGMVQTMADYLIEQGEARGQVRALRRVLRTWLEEKFGTLPDSILQRIEACNDVESLDKAVIKAPRLERLDDFAL